MSLPPKSNILRQNKETTLGVELKRINYSGKSFIVNVLNIRVLVAAFECFVALDSKALPPVRRFPASLLRFREIELLHVADGAASALTVALLWSIISLLVYSAVQS